MNDIEKCNNSRKKSRKVLPFILNTIRERNYCRAPEIKLKNLLAIHKLKLLIALHCSSNIYFYSGKNIQFFQLCTNFSKKGDILFY
jgi:hypothetical protein